MIRIRSAYSPPKQNKANYSPSARGGGYKFRKRFFLSELSKAVIKAMPHKTSLPIRASARTSLAIHNVSYIRPYLGGLGRHFAGALPVNINPPLFRTSRPAGAGKPRRRTRKICMKIKNT
ncbi:hypothetical protein EVAR_24290_1 [Eumeta japonica]|uniref:Uncharacterized protein n=1 Tax=Eumeta variegata TaxID=151549 RepID=A0A4C1VDE6_EUMVA|nr:hypothetical protein EVAR_24290_1 [Eumeta japonica]